MEVMFNDDYCKGYRIYSDGRIYSHKTNRFLKPQPSGNYLSVNVNLKFTKIHRLVAEALLPNPKNKEQINHIDGNKFNNNLNNLEWCSRSENMIHAANEKLVKFEIKKSRKIKQYDLKGTFLKEWESINDAARFINRSKTALLYCCQGKQKTSDGYKWEYVN